MEVFYIDTETVSLKNKCQIIEVAVRHDRTNESFNELIHNLEPLSEDVKQITHITDDMLMDKPSESDVMHRVASFIKDHTEDGKEIYMIAHRAWFDKDKIEGAYERAGIQTKYKWFCTLNLARRNIKKDAIEGYALSTVYEYLKCGDFFEAHRALADVDACRAIFQAMGGLSNILEANNTIKTKPTTKTKAKVLKVTAKPSSSETTSTTSASDTDVAEPSSTSKSKGNAWGSLWTAQDKQVFLDGLYKGKSPQELAKTLNRSENAMKCHLYRLWSQGQLDFYTKESISKSRLAVEEQEESSDTEHQTTIAEQPENAGKKWSNEEHQQFLQELRDGVRLQDIALSHKRHLFAICSRLAHVTEINHALYDPTIQYKYQQQDIITTTANKKRRVELEHVE